MKKGWEYKKLGEICKTYAGGTPLKSCKEYYDGGTIPWLRSGEVCKKYIDQTELFITQKGMDNSSAKYYPKNTVVVAMYGATAAQVGILKIESTSNQAVCGILPNDNFLPEFLYYWFTCIKDFLAGQAQGGAQPNISQVKIKNLIVPIPPLSEQQEIVEYLDSSFAKIDALKANAAKNLEEAKSLFQSALKEVFTPQKGLEIKSLGDIMNLRRGHDLTHSQMIGSDYPVAGSNGKIGTHNDFTPISPCITVGRSGSVGAVNIYHKCWAHNTTLYIDDFKGNFPKYLFYALKSLDLAHYNSGSAVPTLNRNFIHPIKIGYNPDITEQQSIVSHLDSLNEKVNTLQQNYSRICNECDALKQAILRQVFE